MTGLQKHPGMDPVVSYPLPHHFAFLRMLNFLASVAGRSSFAGGFLSWTAAASFEFSVTGGFFSTGCWSSLRWLVNRWLGILVNPAVYQTVYQDDVLATNKPLFRVA